MPRNCAVEHLAPQQVLDLLERLARLVRLASRSRRAPAPPGRGRRAACRARSRAAARRRTGRGTAPRAPAERLVEQLAYLLQGAVEAAALAGLALPLADLAQQLVEARAGLARRGAAAASQRLARRRPSRTTSPISSSACADVERRRQRVGPAVPRPVAVTADAGLVSRRRPSGRAARPWSAVGEVQPLEGELQRRWRRGRATPRRRRRAVQQLGEAGHRAERRSSSDAGTSSPVSTVAPSSKRACSPREVRRRRAGRGRCRRWPGAAGAPAPRPRGPPRSRRTRPCRARPGRRPAGRRRGRRPAPRR